MSQTQPPGPEELEVSVFGPGYGECVLIHVGYGVWLVVDSCIDPKTNRSAPLGYLESIGFDPASAIDLVVASHWHADHVRGLHELYSVASAAKFSCSSVLAGKEFVSLAKIYSEDAGKIPIGPEELYKCLTTLSSRAKATGKVHHRWAITDRLLWQSSESSPLKVKLIALSPSDEMFTRTQQMMLNYITSIKKGYSEPRLIAGCPNDVAVALLLEVNGRQILLGSDLEQEANTSVGWSAVMASEAVKESKCCTFKVAHHGSASGHNDQVWDDLLEQAPIALLTPFRHGKLRIPTQTDRERILRRTEQAFISADPNASPKLPKKATKVQAFVDGTVHNRRLAAGQMGQVRWRAPLNDPADRGRVELFDGAMPLAQVANAA